MSLHLDSTLYKVMVYMIHYLSLQSEDLPTPVEVIDSPPMVLPEYPPPPKTTPPPDYQGGCSGVTSDNNKVSFFDSTAPPSYSLFHDLHSNKMCMCNVVCFVDCNISCVRVKQ